MTITLILTTKGTQDCSLGFGIIAENKFCGTKKVYDSSTFCLARLSFVKKKIRNVNAFEVFKKS